MKRRERMTNPKCLGRAFPDTFSARSADLTGLKMIRITRAASFDHLVGALLEQERHVETERLRGIEIDHKLELAGGLDGKFTRLRAFEDAIGVDRPSSKFLDQINLPRRDFLYLAAARCSRFMHPVNELRAG